MMLRHCLRAPVLARAVQTAAAPQAAARVGLQARHVLTQQPWALSSSRRTLTSTPHLLKSTGTPGFWASKGPVSYDELKPLTEKPTDDVLLVDVREPAEVIQGNIPSSVNLPMSEFEEATNMDDADFFRKYAFRKPSRDQKIIVHCKSGKRSESVRQALKDRGWKDVRNYVGSYDEWRRQEQQNQSSSSEDD